MFDTKRIRGVIPAMVTPMSPTGEPDEAGLRSLVRHLVGQGVNGIFALGSSGEFPLLTPADRARVAAVIADEVGGRIPVLVGASDSGTRQVIEHVRAAAAGGADVAVVLPPYYISPSESEIARHFTMVMDASPIPVLLYNNPESTHVTLSVDLVRELAQHENAAGIKDSSGDFAAFRRLVMAFRGDGRFRVVQGHEGMAALSFFLGAHAGHLGLANVAPRLFLDMYAAATAGDLETALQLQATADDLMAMWEVAGPTDASYLASMKTALAMMGVCGVDLAPPLTGLTASETNRVHEILERHGLLASGPA